MPHLCERGGAWKSPSRGRLACPTPAFSSPLPAIFFFRTPTILNFRIAFWPLETWTKPWTRDHKRECVNSKHNNTRTNHSSVQPSPLAVRRIGNSSAFAWPDMANPAQPENIVTNKSAAARLSGVLLTVLLHCCTDVLGRFVGAWWVVGGWWVAGRRRLARSPNGPVSSKNEPPRLFPVSYKVLKNQPNNSAPRTRCTAVRTAALLYVAKVWSVGGWRVHCVVRGGWVGSSVRESLFASCGR